jgi:hypothetical protein
MSRDSTAHLFRDYGLTLALVLVSVLLLWRTILPQIVRNHDLDRVLIEKVRAKEAALEELRRLEAMDRAGPDPILVERLTREYFPGLPLPPSEYLVQRLPAVED